MFLNAACKVRNNSFRTLELRIKDDNYHFFIHKFLKMKKFSTENEKIVLKFSTGKEPPMVEGALNLCDMPPRFGGRNLQWWRERWICVICHLDLVEGTSNGGGSLESLWYAASIRWKDPRLGGKSLKSPRDKLQLVEEARKSFSKKSLLAVIRGLRTVSNPQLKP